MTNRVYHTRGSRIDRELIWIDSRSRKADRAWEKRMMGNCIGKDHPPEVGQDFSEALILVVGNASESKSRFARDLAEARGATQTYRNKAGVQFFTRQLAPEEPVVMDTAPLKTVEECSLVDTARVWISQNSLRQRSGKLVFVVCVITTTDLRDKIYDTPDFEHNQFSWVHVLANVFEKKKQEIMIVVNSEGSTDEASKEKLRQVLKRDGFKRQENTIFVTWSKTGGYLNTPIIKTILQSSVDRSNSDVLTTIENRCAAGFSPFRLPTVAWSAGDNQRFGPWGPENVLLFGMSGSGKSTLANMLTSGRLDGVDKNFSTSSGVRGETTKVSEGQGRGWRVTDTPGLGESNEDGKSGVSTDRAGKLIKEYVMLVQGVFCHFMYVWKKDRVNESDTILWELFHKVFDAEGIENHMTVVISGADQTWLDENIDHLKKCFEGCENFIAADFPPEDPDGDEETKSELQDVRLQSLKALEEDLASLCRLDSSCRLGMWSIATQRSMIARDRDRFITTGAHVRQSAPFGPSAATPLPSDFETARTYIRMKSLTTRTCLSGKKLDIVPGSRRKPR